MKRLAIVLLVLALHGPLWSRGGFVGDDFLYVRHGLDAGSLSDLHGIVFGRFLGGTAPYFRPATALLEVAEAHAFGTNPLPYFLLGSILHAIAAILLGEAAAALARRGGAAESANRAGTIASVLFAVGPVPLDAVADVAARGDLLAGIFSLAALRAHLNARGRAGPPVLFALALLSKEGAILLPAAVFLLDAVFPEHHQKRWRDAFRGFLPLLGIAAVYLGARWLIFEFPGPRFNFLAAARILGLTRSATELGKVALERIAILHFPANERALAAWFRWTLLGALLAAEASALAPPSRRRKILSGFAASVVLVLLLQGPALLIQVDRETLARSRHLYLAAAAAAAALGCLLARPRSRLPAFAGAIVFAALAIANERPWLRSMERMGRLREQVAAGRSGLAPGAREAILLDAPGHLDGAIFFQPGTSPAFEPPFLDPPLLVLSFTSEQFAEFDRVGGEFRRRLEKGILVFRHFPDGRTTAGRMDLFDFAESLAPIELLEPPTDLDVPAGEGFPAISFRRPQGTGEVELVVVSVPRLDVLRYPASLPEGADGIVRLEPSRDPRLRDLSLVLEAQLRSSDRLVLRIEARAGGAVIARSETRTLRRSPDPR